MDHVVPARRAPLFPESEIRLPGRSRRPCTLVFPASSINRVNSQGRVAAPARFRTAFAEGIVLSRSYDPCIVAYSPDEWQRSAAEITDQAGSDVSTGHDKR